MTFRADALEEIISRDQQLKLGLLFARERVLAGCEFQNRSLTHWFFPELRDAAKLIVETSSATRRS